MSASSTVKLSMRIVIMGLLVLAATRAAAQDPGLDMTVDAATRTAVIDGVLQALTDYYVYPEVAAKMGDAVRQRQQRREYDAVTSARQLAQSLTAHLRDVSGDKHLAVNYNTSIVPPYPIPAPLAISQPSADEVNGLRTLMARQNFGFQKVERLAGNIGYVDLRRFMPLAGDTAAGAMYFLANTEALIIDMRENTGGSLESVPLLASFLFERTAHMIDVHYRFSNETLQYWTLPVPGPRFTGKDVYVLTSKRTFSAAEAFVHGLKGLKRATIVGEVTGGGAHQPVLRRVNDHFAVAVPYGRIVSAATKTDWEGVGVEPDVKVAAAQALATAHLMALEKRAQATLVPSMQAEVTSAITTVKASLQSAK